MAMLLRATRRPQAWEVAVPANRHCFTLAELHAFVDGYIELVYLTDGRVAVVNEEGLLRNLPINPAASVLLGRMIVGDVLVATRIELDMPDEDD